MYFRLRKYCALIFLIALNAVNIQSQELENLKAELKNLSEQKQAAQCLQIALLHIEKYGSPDSVLAYANKAQYIAGHLNRKDHLQMAQLYLAIGLQQKNKFDTAITVLKSVLEKNKNTPDSLRADIYYYLGIVYYRSGDKKTSLEYFIKAVPLYEKTSNMDGLILTYCKLSDVLVTDSQNKEADDYKNKAIALLPKLKKPYAKIFARNLLSRIYMDLRVISPAYIDSSIVIAKEAYELIKEYGYYTRAYPILNIISDNYFVKNEFDLGLQYGKEALKYRKYLYPGEIIMSYMKFADYYNEKGESNKALLYLDSVKGQLPYINVQYYWFSYYQRYFQFNKKAGNLKEAIYGMEHFISIRDSLYNVDKSKEINALVQKYDKVENEKKIMELSKEKEIASVNTKFLIAGIIASLFAVIIIVFFYRQSTIKNKLKTIETEQRLNRARMDPHFFFNALSSLQGLVNDDSKRKEASNYISNFSKIMRQSLESTYIETVSIEQEIDFLTNYLELQKLRTGNKFNFKFQFDKDLEINELLIPSMILQPFIENSIEHGFANAEQGGIITIAFALNESNILVSIIDNGIGLNAAAKNKDHTSRAIQIIKDRLYLLNQKHKTNATFVIGENLNGGTKVEIVLPIIN